MSANPAQMKTVKTGPAQQKDADALQWMASDPGRSVWVAASAGSGKTKVLTDRVLRLLLPQGEGLKGTPPEKILCLTFTRAGAAEMADRLTKALADWAVSPGERLHKNLSDLLGRAPAAFEAEAARRLFAQVIDAEGGLKILTIHSFCQSVLGRFPIEAGLPPHFQLIDDREAAALKSLALASVIGGEAGPDVQAALARLSVEKGEAELPVLLHALMAERRRLTDAFFTGSAGLYDRLGIPAGATPHTLLEDAFRGFDPERWRAVCAALKGARKSTMEDAARNIGAMLDETLPLADAYEKYRLAFLTKDGEVRKNPTVKGMDPAITEDMKAEAGRLEKLEDARKAARCAMLSADLLRVGQAYFEAYQRQKARRAALDYDDLIARTLDLLTGRSMNMPQKDVTPWVMFKLDQGIDHILVDEAQDTNPDQWEIVHALAEEFFSGSGARDAAARTLFAVGDEKQSIFGFQRAAPEKFHEAQVFYKNRADAAGLPFTPVPMTVSFRSTGPVLALVDAVFDGTEPWRMLGLQPGTRVQHSSNRIGQAGLVELWPLVEFSPAPPAAPWAPPVEVEPYDDAEARMARRIAGTVAGWIGREELPARGRTVRAGDVMILVKSRGTLMDHLVRALKAAGVPVSGVDRMRLDEQIAIEDLMAAARFALQPDDDLTLACLLKSPLVGLDEQGLYAAAIDRTGTLWSAVRDRLPDEISGWLAGLIRRGSEKRPFEFFSDILHLPCPGGSSGRKAMLARLGEESVDPIEEFLGATLDYETANPPTLQQFVAWQEDGSIEIKREMEAAGDKVRIMTVHGSKGLQAPVVILPDTVHTGAEIARIGTTERVQWTPAGPLWSPRAGDDCEVYAKLLEARRERMAQEYKRLLYVAMTRAADRLYIGGLIKSERKIKAAETSWYGMVAAGFKALGDQVVTRIADDGGLLPTLTLACGQTAPPDKADKPEKSGAAAPMDWSWLGNPPPEEESPPKPLAPSRPSMPEPVVLSPLQDKSDLNRFRRGNLTHALLQYLPGLPAAQWPGAAARFTARQGGLDDKTAQGIAAEALAILNDARFKDLFGPGSMAEVPVTAQIGKTLVSGQIDRLLVRDDEILIVDFKTNRPPPLEEKDVPALYRSQLAAYRDVVGRIYPGRPIKTFLLWTDGPRMMEIKPG